MVEFMMHLMDVLIERQVLRLAMEHPMKHMEKEVINHRKDNKLFDNLRNRRHSISLKTDIDFPICAEMHKNNLRQIVDY